MKVRCSQIQFVKTNFSKHVSGQTLNSTISSAHIKPTTIRFIKLGEKGMWERSCIEDGTIRLGYDSPHHQDCLARRWDIVYKYWFNFRSGNHKKGTATRDINQVRDFYELDSNTLWFTFYNRKLWWCFAQPEVTELEDLSRIRYTLNGWSSVDVTGRDLSILNIDGRVTKVQGFRGTICGLEEMGEYLVRRINGLTPIDVIEAETHLDGLAQSIKNLVHGLHWKDFELLTDLIFTQEGWQRTSELGKTEKDIDLDMFSPVTRRRAFVQVKSKGDINVLNETITAFEGMEGFDELFFVIHSPDASIRNYISTDRRINVIDDDRIADLVINAGLVRWLINKRS